MQKKKKGETYENQALRKIIMHSIRILLRNKSDNAGKSGKEIIYLHEIPERSDKDVSTDIEEQDRCEIL